MLKYYWVINLLILALFISCSEDRVIVEASKDLNDYPIYDYEISKKQYVLESQNDSFYSANVLINSNQKKGTYLNMDSIYQYCLSIAYNEKLSKARIFRKSKSFDIVNKLELKTFSLNEIRESTSNEDFQIINSYLIGFIDISSEKENWKNQLSSENINTGGFKQISNSNGPTKKRIFKIE